MANPTTNYGFVLPTSSDLVTDLPADFDVALQGVDTRLKALQPGTTLGDLAYSSATANTNTRLAIGSSGQVLSVSGGVPAWTTVAASGLTKIVTANFTSSASVQINNCFTSTYSNYILVLNQLGNSGGGALYLQWQTGTNTIKNSADYYGGGWSVTNGNSTSTFTNNGDTKMTLAPTVATNLRQNFTINISNVAVETDVGSSSRHANLSSLGNGAGNGIATYAGIVNDSGTYTGVCLTANGNLTGTYTVYGLAK
jgi:hypothetical protein